MAKLSTLRVNSAAIEQGAWVSPGDEYEDLQIKTRGFTAAYSDARDAKFRKAALAYGGDTRKIPSQVRSDIVVDCIVDHLLLGVRNVVDDTGAPIDLARFVVLLRDPNYTPLVSACISAAALVGNQQAEDQADAVGN